MIYLSSTKIVMNQHKNSQCRNKRIAYILFVVVTIFLGLCSRKFSDLLPFFVSENAGDALWAMMVYFCFRFLFIRKSLYLSILLSLIFSFGIEFSQLYQEDWINQIRSTLLGALILGKGFLIVDLFRYATGILIAFILDWTKYRL